MIVTLSIRQPVQTIVLEGRLRAGETDVSARLMAAPRTMVAGLVSFLLVFGVLGLAVPSVARADSAPIDPASPATPRTATADALPTVQVNGVVWSQVVIGDTVYAAGQFTRARPAGAAAGTQETVRNNLLAYDIRTGALLTSFAPDLNGQATVVTASPDGSRLYVGGAFTQANGQARYRLAAYDTATGAVVANFAPAVNGRVQAIAATASTVYFGGSFPSVGSAPRDRLAAVSASNGALLPWAPVPGVGSTAGNSLPNNPTHNAQTTNDVRAMVMTGNGSQVVVAGHFDTLNGTRSTGIGALDPVSGATLPFAAGRQITNQGVNSAIYSLSTDGTTVYGTAYDFYGPGNLEGAFAVTAAGGAVKWIADCHGDTYSSYPFNGALYVAGHPHVCSNIGGYPEQDPRQHRYATALSLEPTGTVGNATVMSGFPQGQPAPTLQSWFPDLTVGTVTGQQQSAWSVSGNSRYVVFGGEFPRVNGVVQQGLVRFAMPDNAPNKIAPDWSADLTPGVTLMPDGGVRVTWRATSDKDNENLTYRVYRDGTNTRPVYEVTKASPWWDRPMMGFFDSTVTPGAHTYRVVVSDPLGNTATNAATSVTVPAGTPAQRAYADRVRADGATDYWPLGESSGTTAYSYAGGSDMTISTGVTPGETGALAGDANTAFRFSGSSSGYLATGSVIPGPRTFTVEAWFSTTSTNGGKIIGFGDRNTRTSSSYDRHVYVNRNGKVSFGVYPGSERVITSDKAYNDGAWHHVAASLGEDGMALYVDGRLVAYRTDTTSAQVYNGYWKVGGDTGWANGGTFLNGRIDEVAVYPAVLSAGQVANHHSIGATGRAINVPPTAAFSSTTAGLTASFDASTSSDSDGTVATYAWVFGDGTTGSGATTSHLYTAGGTFPVTLTVTDDDGATAEHTATVTVAAPPPNAAPTAAFTSTMSHLGVALDGSGSTDTDGTLTSFAWNFGDGTTGAGATTSHTYTAAGTYDVTLTVTDDDGATNSVAKKVTVTSPPPPPPVVAADTFGRTATGGFGTADTGGAWAAYAGSTTLSVSGGTGRMQVTAPGASVTASLTGVSVTDSASQVAVSLDKVPAGGSTWVYLTSRVAGNNHYRAAVRFAPGGGVELGVTRVINGAETAIRSVPVSGLTYTPGTVLQVRFDVSGTGTTALKAKVWVTGATEPAAWQVDVTDSTAALQAAGRVGLAMYTSGLSTVAPLRIDVDNLWTGPSGSAPSSGGGTGTPANAAPTAAFTAGATGLTAALDGRGSTDADGTIASYAWNFGDGSTGTGATVSHPYAAAGTYQVTLTVTDNGGRTGTLTSSVTVAATPPPPPANVAPTAAFTVTASGLTASVDGSASADSDGTVATYDWDFGDGLSGTGVTTSHPYTTPGTYTVVLTVTDDDGVTDTETKQVTVTAPGPVAPALASDAFSRAVASGWGTADTGGTWTTYTGNATMSVSGGAGHMEVAGAGGSAAGYLGSVSASEVAMQVDVSLDRALSGGSTWVYLNSRWTGQSYYRAVVRFVPDGSVALGISRVVNGVETTLQSVNLPGLTYTPGTVLRVRFDTSGTDVTTLRTKAWVVGTAEPAAWQVTATDATEALRAAGRIGLSTYLSGSATSALGINLDNLWSGAVGTTPPTP